MPCIQAESVPFLARAVSYSARAGAPKSVQMLESRAAASALDSKPASTSVAPDVGGVTVPTVADDGGAACALVAGRVDGRHR